VDKKYLFFGAGFVAVERLKDNGSARIPAQIVGK
jgi:hypothetical protein